MGGLFCQRFILFMLTQSHVIFVIKIKFSGSSTVTFLCVCAQCVCVYSRTMLKLTSAFIHKQKDHSVLKLSLVLHGCLYQLMKLRKPMWVDKKRNLQRNKNVLFLLFDFLLVCLYGPRRVGFQISVLHHG